METNKIDHFNTLLSTNEINILKILTFYLGGNARELAASMVLIQEFELLKHHVLSSVQESPSDTIHYFFEEIDPFLEASSSQDLHRMRDFMNQLENIKSVMDMMNEMKSEDTATDSSEADAFVDSFFSSLF